LSAISSANESTKYSEKDWKTPEIKPYGIPQVYPWVTYWLAYGLTNYVT
jgi:hypothetical protein